MILAQPESRTDRTEVVDFTAHAPAEGPHRVAPPRLPKGTIATPACGTGTRSRKRTHDSLRSKFWLTVRHIEAFIGANAHRLHGNGIDYGCGEKPYAGLVTPHCAHLLGVDVEPSAGGTVNLIVERGAPLPIADATFDFALCTQVLEHVPNPGLVLSELARVLRPGGILLLTAPFVWQQHEEPHDYYRFTEYGLTELAARASLSVESLRPGGGMIEVLGQLVIHRLPSLGPLDWFVCAPMNLLAAALDRLLPLPGITCNWQVVLRK